MVGAPMLLKKQIMKARGIRFTEDQWKKITVMAKKEKAKPSDVVRHIVDQYFLHKKDPK